MKTCELWQDENNEFIVLSNLKFDDSGNLVGGYVTNGAWHWSRDDEFEYAKTEDGRIKNKWPRRDYIIRYNVEDEPQNEISDEIAF